MDWGKIGGSNQLQIGRVNFHRGGLTDEIQANEHGVHAIALLDPAFNAAQRAMGYFHAAAFPDGGCETNFEIGVQGTQDFAQLVDEEFLIGDDQQIGDVFGLADAGSLTAS